MLLYNETFRPDGFLYTLNAIIFLWYLLTFLSTICQYTDILLSNLLVSTKIYFLSNQVESKMIYYLKVCTINMKHKNNFLSNQVTIISINSFLVTLNEIKDHESNKIISLFSWHVTNIFYLRALKK